MGICVFRLLHPARVATPGVLPVVTPFSLAGVSVAATPLTPAGGALEWLDAYAAGEIELGAVPKNTDPKLILQAPSVLRKSEPLPGTENKGEVTYTKKLLAEFLGWMPWHVATNRTATPCEQGNRLRQVCRFLDADGVTLYNRIRWALRPIAGRGRRPARRARGVRRCKA